MTSVLKDLKELCSKAITEISEEKARRDNVANEIPGLTAKKTLLESEVTALKEQRDTLEEKTKAEKRVILDSIDQKLKDAADTKVKAESELERARQATNALQAKTDEADKLKAEYEEKLAALVAREAQLADKVAHIEELKAKLV